MWREETRCWGARVQGGGVGDVGGRKKHYHVLLLTIKSLALCLTRARERALTHSSTLRSQNQLRISEKCGMYHRFSSLLPSLLSRASGRERCCLGSWIPPTEKRFPCDVFPPPLVTLPQTKKASRVAGKSCRSRVRLSYCLMV